jgi:prevent-host-death family protein
MRIAPLADVKARLSAYVAECEAIGPIVITRNGKAVAVLLAPTDDADLERLLLARAARFQALLAKSRQSIKAGKGLTREDFWKTVERRARNRSSSKSAPRRPASNSS